MFDDRDRPSRDPEPSGPGSPSAARAARRTALQRGSPVKEALRMDARARARIDSAAITVDAYQLRGSLAAFDTKENPRSTIAACPLRRRLDAVLDQDALEGVSPDLVAERCERSLDPRVAPRRILGSHPNNQRRRAVACPRTPRTPLLRVPVSPDDEATVPPQHRVGRDHRRVLAELLSAEIRCSSSR